MRFLKRALVLAVPFFIFASPSRGTCSVYVLHGEIEGKEPRVLYRLAGGIYWATVPKYVMAFDPTDPVTQIGKRLKLGHEDYTFFLPAQWRGLQALARTHSPLPLTNSTPSFPIAPSLLQEAMNQSYVAVPTWYVERLIGGDVDRSALYRVDFLRGMFDSLEIPYAEEIHSWTQFKKFPVKESAVRAAKWHLLHGGTLKFTAITNTSGGVLDDFTHKATGLHGAGKITRLASIDLLRNLISLDVAGGTAAQGYLDWVKGVESDLIAQVSTSAITQAGFRAAPFWEKTAAWLSSPIPVEPPLPEDQLRQDLQRRLSKYFVEVIVLERFRYFSTQEIFIEFKDVFELLFGVPVNPELKTCLRQFVNELKDRNFHAGVASEKAKPFHNALNASMDAEIKRWEVDKIARTRNLVEFAEETRRFAIDILGLQSAGKPFDPDRYPSLHPQVKTTALQILMQRDKHLIYPETYDQFRSAILTD